MKKISNNELINIEGGAIKWGIAAIIAGGISFIIGIIDGIVRPYKCR